MWVRVWAPRVHLCLSVGLWIKYDITAAFSLASRREPLTLDSAVSFFSHGVVRGFPSWRRGRIFVILFSLGYKTVWISAWNMSEGAVLSVGNGQWTQVSYPRMPVWLWETALNLFPALRPLSGILTHYHNWIFKRAWCHKFLINTLSQTPLLTFWLQIIQEWLKNGGTVWPA